MCTSISLCVWQEATRAVRAEWGFMMKFRGNLKSPIIEPESEKNRERGERERGGMRGKRWEERKGRRVRGNKRLHEREKGREN